ncbi:hypothetical protein M9Y10_006057 [Tritrichomonas musculus]|uniref:Uncharacterized protein n=1 Tax=Tritrichomonas musculus TaxID=1915356 RepID=A0ABR2JE63_9EUKA
MKLTKIIIFSWFVLLTYSIFRLIINRTKQLTIFSSKPSVFWAVQPNYIIPLSSENLNRIPPSMNYSSQSKEWYTNGNLDPYEIYNPYMKSCLLCHFTVRNKDQNSSTRDAIFSFMFSDIAGLLPFTRSLRTTGSQCRVFIFSDEKSMLKITQDELMVLDRCSITLVKTGYSFSKMNWAEIILLRYPFFYDFLFYRRHLIDRVIIVDLYDTVFQGDPFTSNFKSEYFYFAEENTAIENCWINALWLQKAAPDSYEEIKGNKVLNAGLFLGGTLPVLQFLDIYLKFYEKKRMNMTAPDQGYFNYVAYTIILKNDRFKAKILTSNDGIIVLSYFQEKETKFVLGSFKPKDADVYPRIIHQYDTRSEFRVSVLFACPKGKLNTSTYIRGLDQLPDEEQQYSTKKNGGQSIEIDNF